MENRVQEFAEKIYREGVERGNEEAQRLIAKAEAEAAEIIKAAEEKAQVILNEAKKKAQELDENTKSELKLYAGQSVNALKSEIATMLTDNVVKASVQDFVNDKEYLNKFIVSLASQWVENESVVISTSDAENLKGYFVQNAKGLLDKGVTIEEVNGIKALFTIAPADGSYKINFGAEEFENYFKAFLRPQLIDILF